MEIEDFDDDAGLPPARPPPRNPSLQGRGPRRGNAGDFGLAGEVAVADPGVGLVAEMERLGVQGPEGAEVVEGFGLAVETTGRRPGGGPPPLRGRGGGLQPLGGPGARTGMGLAPLGRPPLSSPPPRRPAPTLPNPADYGLAAEAEEAAELVAATPAGAGTRPPRGPQAFGLASDMAAEPEYGLDQDVAAASGAGVLPPSGLAAQRPRLPRPPAGAGGYGLAEEIQEGVEEAELDAMAAAAAAAAAVEAAEQPMGQFGLDQEVAAAGLGPLGPDGQPLVSAYGYGLDVDIAQDQMQQQQLQQWIRPLDGTLSLEQLDQLPEDQRWLHLEARQAERIMWDLAKQGTVPKIVDIKDVREKLIDASNPPRMAYLAAVEQATQDHRMAANCRPSLLQTKLKTGQNKLRKLLDPVLDPGGQGFVDLSYTPDGALLPETTRVWQFGLSLVQADGVGKTGLQRVRQPCLFIARMALFDRRANRFLGNVFGVRPEAVSNYDKRWEFDPNDRVIVRCNCVQADPQAGTRLVTEDAVSVFIEFNVSYRLAVQDTVNMPQSEDKCAQLLDEINTCWAMISFKKCISLTREVEISVPLYFGSIYDPKPMTAYYAEKRSKAGFWSALKPKESPVLQFRVGPLNMGKPPLVPYAYMPCTMLATHDLATALAAYRMSLALTLARQAGPFAPSADPVLAGFPPLLSDHHLLAEFLTRWKDLTNKMTAVLDADRGCCSPEVLPPLAAMVEAFRRCVIDLAPLAHCPTIPPRHINNFVEYQGHRLRLVQHYCHVLDPKSNAILGQRNPVEPLSHAGFEFLHAPFDVSEIRVSMADRLENPQPFYRY